MAYTLDKEWKDQQTSQMTTSIAFAENEEELGTFTARQQNADGLSINDIFRRKQHLTMSLLSLENPEFLERLETTNIITTS
tara:strand:- start:946 stop:1188 length:243 start_codon:yes stop_codon:yes gene_type:complete